MLSHKISLSKFKMIEIMYNIFSDPNRMKLEIKTGIKFDINKYVKIKQLTPKNPMYQRKNHK